MNALRNLKNKVYPWWRFDVLFSKKKAISVKIIENGGWHFTNIKNANDIYKKMNFIYDLICCSTKFLKV